MDFTCQLRYLISKIQWGALRQTPENTTVQRTTAPQMQNQPGQHQGKTCSRKQKSRGGSVCKLQLSFKNKGEELQWKEKRKITGKSSNSMHAGRRQRLIGNSITFVSAQKEREKIAQTPWFPGLARTHTRGINILSHPISAQPKPTAPPEPGGGPPHESRTRLVSLRYPP